MGERRVAAVVLGMHRSGTSAVAGTLAHLGLQQPRTLFPPSADNPAGYFESPRIVAANHHILSVDGCAWTTCLKFNATRTRRSLAAHMDTVLRDILLQEYGNSGPFVVKDPRLCVTLPLWQPALKLLGVDQRYLIVARHPLEVCRSLAARDTLPQDRAAALWLHHLLEAERATRAGQRAVVLYDDVMSDWRSTVRRAGEVAGIDWPIGIDKAGNDVDRFLAAPLRHHKAHRYSAMLGPAPVDRLVSDTWSALRHLARAPDDAAALHSLDRVYTAFSHWRAV